MKLVNIFDFNLNKLYNIYTIINKQQITDNSFLISKFFLYIHKKLHYFNVTTKQKQFVFSNGQLLQVRTKLTKFFKKSRKSYGAGITALNKKLKKKLIKINFFFCKNFNYKNYLWMKKFTTLIDPTINNLIITNG